MQLVYMDSRLFIFIYDNSHIYEDWLNCFGRMVQLFLFFSRLFVTTKLVGEKLKEGEEEKKSRATYLLTQKDEKKTHTQHTTDMKNVTNVKNVIAYRIWCFFTLIDTH